MTPPICKMRVKEAPVLNEADVRNGREAKRCLVLVIGVGLKTAIRTPVIFENLGSKTSGFVRVILTASWGILCLRYTRIRK